MPQLLAKTPSHGTTTNFSELLVGSFSLIVPSQPITEVITPTHRSGCRFCNSAGAVFVMAPALLSVRLKHPGNNFFNFVYSPLPYLDDRAVCHIQIEWTSIDAYPASAGV